MDEERPATVGISPSYVSQKIFSLVVSTADEVSQLARGWINDFCSSLMSAQGSTDASMTCRAAEAAYAEYQATSAKVACEGGEIR